MRKWKRGAGLALAAVMTLSLMMAGMTVSAYADTEQDKSGVRSLFTLSAEPTDYSELKTENVELGYYEGNVVRPVSDTPVQCVVLPAGGKLSIDAEADVTYQVRVKEHVLDGAGEYYVGSYDAVLGSDNVLTKDGTIVFSRDIKDPGDTKLKGKISFGLPLDLSWQHYEDYRYLLYEIRIYASKDSDTNTKESAVLYCRVEDSEVPVEEENPVKKFTDVPADAWYRGDINTACRLGLINGRTATTFVPNGDLTYAEAVKLAACMNQKYTEGSVTLVNGSEHWYDTYVSYAKEKGIIDRDYAWNDAATRAGYVEIFANALPAEAFSVKNEIADGAVPDVEKEHPQAEAIYKLYRAGILNGNDKEGTFKPDNSIRRCEVAAILTRMMDPDSRVEVSL